MDKKKYAKKLLDYLNNAPTPFQSVDLLKAMLDKAGAIEIKDGDPWNLERSKAYYIIKDGTQIAAFKIGTKPIEETGLRIVAAHHDSPGFRVKPGGSTLDGGYERLTVEGYGGLIVHGWMDRPLGLAGRVCVKDGGNVRCVNVNIDKPILVIPSAAIHVVREVNDGAKFNLQTETCPFLCKAGEKKRFMSYLAEQTGVKEEDILSFELAPYDCTPGCFTGIDGDFVSACRTDDDEMAFTAFTAFCEAIDSDNTCLAFAYDHEEIGSGSTRGARSNTMQMIIDRICEKFAVSQENKYRALAHSLVFSADMAHATHPAYAGKYDPSYPVVLNKGPVLKLTERQSYATSPSGSAVFKMLCERSKIPYQIQVNRSDERGGGTIGPGIAAEYGVVTVDIGNPCLSMHAVRELVGAEDVGHMVDLMKALYNSDLNGIL